MQAGKNCMLLTILVSAWAMLGSTGAYGQVQEADSGSGVSPKFGVKAGYNFSTLFVDNVQNENVKVGLNVGLFAKIPLAKAWSIQPELLYTNKGAQLTYGNIVMGTGVYRFNLRYIEVPLLFVFNLTHNFNLSAGGYAAYLTSANVKDMHSDGTVAGVTSLKEDNFNRVDYGLAGGFGFDMNHFTMGARYNYGLQAIGKPGSLSGVLMNNSKNSVFSIYFGYAF